MGYAGHRHEDLAVSFEPHSRCGTYCIRDLGATHRKSCLLSVGFSQRTSAANKQFGYFRQRLLVHLDLAIEIPRKAWLGDVIAGRSESACNEYHIGSFLGLCEGSHDLLLNIADGSLSYDFDPDFVKFQTHPLSVGVYNLSIENFITDGKEFSKDGLHSQMFGPKYTAVVGVLHRQPPEARPMPVLDAFITLAPWTRRFPTLARTGNAISTSMASPAYALTFQLTGLSLNPKRRKT